MENYVRLNTTNKGVVIIEFFSQSHNSLGKEQLSKLVELIQSVEENPDISIILIKSFGDRTFCAGANFQELKSIRNKEEGKEFFMGFARLIIAMRNSSKIIISRIQGKAVGGGVGIIAASDISYATKFASIRLSEINLGIGPFVIEPMISKRIGLSHFMNLCLHPDAFYNAEWCMEKGLYQRVFDNNTELDFHLQEYLEQLSRMSKPALKEIKRIGQKNLAELEQLLENRAAISGSLILTPQAQDLLKKN